VVSVRERSGRGCEEGQDESRRKGGVVRETNWGDSNGVKREDEARLPRMVIVLAAVVGSGDVQEEEGRKEGNVKRKE
jgi:hypothetical protein